jgi:hypothetical protein
MGVYVDKNGKPDNTWSQVAAATLKKQYEKYEIVRLVPFDERFEVVHINYDTEFHKLLSRWQQESQAIMAAGVATSAPEVKKLLKHLNGVAENDDNFAWTHFSDVVLYKFFSLVRQRIKIHVANQFQQALAPNTEGAVTSWSVIAHSLGTIVTHDVLQALDATTPNEAGMSIKNAMVPNADVVAMIANVSKVMENDHNVYTSHVVPGSMVQHGSVCFNYLNCNNKYDPFVLPVPFKPKNKPAWDMAAANGSYLDISTKNIHEVNVHSIENYLVNPKVHIPLLERLVGIGAITDAEKQKAAQKFKDIPDAALEKQAKKIAEKIKDEKWFNLVGKYYALLKELQ